MHTRPTHRGLLYAGAACLLWGTTYIALELIYRSAEIDPLFVAFWRCVAAAGVLVAVSCRRGPSTLKLSGREIPRVILLAATGVLGLAALGALSVRHTSAINTSLLLNSNPIMIVVLSAFIGERLGWKSVVGVLIGFGGCFLVVRSGASGLVSGEATGSELLGNLLGLGAGACWAVYTIAGKSIVRRRGGLAVATVTMILGAAMLGMLAALVSPWTWPSMRAVFCLIYLGVVPTALGFVLWFKGLEESNASRIAPLQYLAPTGTVVLAWLLLDQTPTASAWAGMVFIFVGIYLAVGLRLQSPG